MKLCSRIFIALLLVVFMGFCSGCSDDSNPTPYNTASDNNPDTLTSDQDEEPQAEEPQEEVPNVPASVVFDTPNPQTIIVEQTSQVSVTVTNSSGQSVEPGTDVSFTLVDSQYGSLDPGTAVTNAVGVASTTFTAATVVGDVLVNASAGGVAASASATITISGSDPAMIQFADTSANVIALEHTASNLTAIVRFIVRDGNNNPVPGQSVRFDLYGPNGGEYINEDPAGNPARLFVSTNSDGYAQVILHSGSVAGPVTISAAILDQDDNPNLFANAPVISIGGGVPTQKRFDAGTTIKNLPGLNYVGREFEITAYLADRFGNFNVLDGTSVSFVTEKGITAFSSDVSADANGMATVTLRTQGGAPEDVEADSLEIDLIDDLNADYFGGGLTYDVNPRDALANVLIYTKGEEHFVDANANGVYDSDETIEHTVDDPFCDYNNDGVFTDGTGANPWEQYIDADGNGVYDGSNGVWDDDKFIFLNFPILISGEPMVRLSNATVFPTDIRFIVCDSFFNNPTSGTSFKVTQTFEDGELAGLVEYEYADSNNVTRYLSQIEHSVSLSGATGSGTIDIELLWEGLTKKYSFGFTVPAP